MFQIREFGPVTSIRMSRAFLGRPVRWARVYLVDGLLIDSGPPCTAQELVIALRDRRLTQVVNTHQHEDHVGGSAALKDGLGITPQAPAMTVPFLENPPRIHLYRRVVWGRPRPVHAVPIDDGWIKTPQYRFQLIHTPGHVFDHHVLFEPDRRWLFSADLYLAERAKYLRVDEDLGQLMSSLRLAADLEPQTIYCAHAGVVQDATAALQRKIAYWERLIADIHGLHEQGLDLPVIRDRVLGPEGGLTRMSSGHFSKLNFVKAALALADVKRKT
jgi:glyoxylase-like metal-dependent hydrolase (beta-lactamase superfamily II)